MNLPGEKINVLDHGYVQLVDVMGDDQAIVDAARVSIAGENVKAQSSNVGLIRYLMRHRHTTPFEMVEFKFRCKMPIFVARQWIRHRTANVNEMSGRYSELPEEFYVPELDVIKKQASANKQGRSAEGYTRDDQEAIRTDIAEQAGDAFKLYRSLLSDDLARELARIDLPLSTYTEWIWKIDLHNLMHFLGLRLHPHAQYEIRVYGEAMAPLVKAVCPIAYEAFEDFRLNALFLSAQDVAGVKHLLRQLIDLIPSDSPQVDGFDGHKTNRELVEFTDKLNRLGMPVFMEL
jgi:thymidylate synthase (FAD)